MKKSSEKAIEVNNELRLNVDEQQDNKNHLKLKWDIVDADEVQEITAVRTSMNNRISLCVWHVTQHWHWKIGLKKLIMDEHTELLWNYWGKMFRNWKEVDNHIFEACKPITSQCTSKDEVKNYNGIIVVEKEE